MLQPPAASHHQTQLSAEYPKKVAKASTMTGSAMSAAIHHQKVKSQNKFDIEGQKVQQDDK